MMSQRLSAKRRIELLEQQIWSLKVEAVELKQEAKSLRLFNDSLLVANRELSKRVSAAHAKAMHLAAILSR
jgi:regulator of replication initiation timing